MKVLIIDPVLVARLNIRNALEKENLNVIEADSGISAIKKYQKEHPEVICLDINLPDLNGLTLISYLKHINRNLKFVVITAEATEINVKKAFSEGAYYFFAKPVNLDSLTKTVKELF